MSSGGGGSVPSPRSEGSDEGFAGGRPRLLRGAFAMLGRASSNTLPPLPETVGWRALPLRAPPGAALPACAAVRPLLWPSASLHAALEVAYAQAAAGGGRAQRRGAARSCRAQNKPTGALLPPPPPIPRRRASGAMRPAASSTTPPAGASPILRSIQTATLRCTRQVRGAV